MRNNIFFTVMLVVLCAAGVALVTFIPWHSAKAGVSIQAYISDLLEQDSEELQKQKQEYKKIEIERILDEAYNNKLFNGQVLYAENGEILIKKTYGYSDLHKKTQIDDTWKFQLSSTSKPITAVAIMKLYDEGKIDINKSVKHYLPDFPFSENITVKHLLQHRSGLPNYIYLADKNWDKKQTFTNRNLSAFLKNLHAKVKCAPGTVFEYCNTNYAYLALLVEKCSGFTFEFYVKTKIFDPLKMTNSFVYNPTKGRQKKTVKGYSFSRRRGFYERPIEFADGTAGDKGIYSTAEDLFKFDQGILDTNFLSKKSKKLMITPAKPLSAPKYSDYGLGFRIRTDSTFGGERVFHNGWWNGFRSYYIHNPKNDRTLIWLNNRSDVTLGPIINQILMLVDSIDNPAKYEHGVIPEVSEEEPEYYGDDGE